MIDQNGYYKCPETEEEEEDEIEQEQYTYSNGNDEPDPWNTRYNPKESEVEKEKNEKETKKMNNLLIMDNNAVIETLTKIAQFQAIIKQTLKPGHDFDTIPGTNKPSLMKPGAEKICMLFGVCPTYEIMSSIEDYEKEFFSYNIRCSLIKNGEHVGQGIGSCNSKESKYRYTNVAESNIPQHLDKSTLQSKIDKYGKTKYKIDNDDTCSQVNTILKMAKKRAHVDATLQLAALSEIFTQDIEDMKHLIQNEQSENMTLDEAASMIVNFGKHKGKTTSEVWKTAYSWIEWFYEKGTDDVLKKAFRMLDDAARNTKKPVENIPVSVSANVSVDDNIFAGTPFDIAPPE